MPRPLTGAASLRVAQTIPTSPLRRPTMQKGYKHVGCDDALPENATAFAARQCASGRRILGVPYTAYRRSMRIDWSNLYQGAAPSCGSGHSTVVASASGRALRRLVVALSDAPKDWAVMATLTFRERAPGPKEPLEKFQRLMRAAGYGDLQWAWVMEFQERGVEHYHFLWEGEALAERGLLCDEHRQKIRRKGHRVELLRGPFEAVVVACWMKAVGDKSEEFAAFQHGGIVEFFRSANGAACYFGSYLGKASQKTLPHGIEGCGRWWQVSKNARPIAESMGVIVGNYPLTKPFRTVFDKTTMLEHTLQLTEAQMSEWFADDALTKLNRYKDK